MFFLEIGNPVQREGSLKQHGEWHFLIECCFWRFETTNKVLVASEDDQPSIDETFEMLNLGSVESAAVSSPAFDLAVKFSSEITFRTFSPESTDRYTQWLLYGPPGEAYTWVVHGGGKIKCITGDEPVN
jgi:hypothetical protein